MYFYLKKKKRHKDNKKLALHCNTNLSIKLLPLSAVAVKVLPFLGKYAAYRDVVSGKLGKKPRASDYGGTSVTFRLHLHPKGSLQFTVADGSQNLRVMTFFRFPVHKPPKYEAFHAKICMI